MTVSRSIQAQHTGHVLGGGRPYCMVNHAAIGRSHDVGVGIRNSWCQNHEKFMQFYDYGVPVYSMFAKGNKKLKFWQFSALPDFTCPGAGDCLSWCYSFKAHRYPAAYYRQLQNTMLIRRRDSALVEAWQSLPVGEIIRLYVDGDHDSMATLKFWFDLCDSRRDLSVYGYSKSWQLFQGYDRLVQAGVRQWPTNYWLNTSGGSKFGKAMHAQMVTLPIWRGDFVAAPVAVKMPKLGKRGGAQWVAFSAAVRAYMASVGVPKVFVCPGRCFDCMGNGDHACGSAAMKGVTVAIGLH